MWQRAELEQRNSEVETEEALLVTEGRSVDDVRHTVDGDLRENFTRLSRKIEVAETESQLALRVGGGILGERVSAPGALRDFLPRFSSGRSSRPSPRTSGPHFATPCRFTVPQVELRTGHYFGFGL